LETLDVNSKKIIAGELQKDILRIEGYKPLSASEVCFEGLEVIEQAFPNGKMPLGTVHEFLAFEKEQFAVSVGFISGLLQAMMKRGGISVWVSTRRLLFPTALKAFGLEADRIVFADVQSERDVLWVAEEALKCKGIVAVIAEVRELTFMQSRRLQLAVEASNVTGFIIRDDARKLSTTACAARWHIISKQSELEEGMPGVGQPRWEVELQKVRNGKPGKWIIEWSATRFNIIEEHKFRIHVNKHIRQAG
jgi:protein ImuA